MKHIDDNIITKKRIKSHTKWFGINFEKESFTFFMYLVLFVILLFVGGFTFNRLESIPEYERYLEHEIERQYQKDQIIILLNGHTVDEETSHELLLQLQEHSLGFSTEPFVMKWSFTNSVLFSFTILTTIGYGRFSPKTLAGQIFLMIYALIGIPLTAICLARGVDRILNIFKWISQVGNDKVEKVFHALDADDSGELDEDEFAIAMKELGVELNPEEFEEIWTLVDQGGSGTIDLEEFRELVENLHINLTSVAAKKNENIITAVVITGWIGIGVLGFSLLEGWSPFTSLYFLCVSLTTIGLGDVIPSSHRGGGFLIVYGLIGLGLVALLLTVVQNRIGNIQSKRFQQFKKSRESKQIKKKLKKIPKFASMTDYNFQKIIESSETIKVDPNIEIFHEGDKMKKIYYLIRGEIAVYKNEESNENGKILSKGSLLFESSMSENFATDTYLADATLFSKKKVKLLVVDPTDLNKLTNKNTIDIPTETGSKVTTLDSNLLLHDEVESDEENEKVSYEKDKGIMENKDSNNTLDSAAVTFRNPNTFWTYGLH